MMMRSVLCLVLSFLPIAILIMTKMPNVAALHVVLAGGTGPLGRAVAHAMTTLSSQKDDDVHVTILTRNAFLAATPTRVSRDFGWVGKQFVETHPSVSLRDWDGGDLLDIVGKDWVGWQEDTLPHADVVVHLVGGFTEQRVMACQRLVQECVTLCPDAFHLTVSPKLEDLSSFSPGVTKLKASRIEECEKLVQYNCRNFKCLRIEAFRLQKACDDIVGEVKGWTNGCQATQT